jgi:hypothetical protein
MLKKFIKKFKGVWVIKIWRRKNVQVELLIFPPNKVIHPHYHEHTDNEIVHLFGSALYGIMKDKKPIRYYATAEKDHLVSFTVPANSIHWANIGYDGLICLSIQRWSCDEKISVIDDYKELTIQEEKELWNG